MARTATLTLTPKEAALLFTIVSMATNSDDDMTNGGILSPGDRRIARQLQAKTTAALIATHKEGGS